MTEENVKHDNEIEDATQLRKASDVILSLESKIDQLTQTVKNYCFNTTLILKAVNSLNSKIDSILEESSDLELEQPVLQDKIEVDENPIGVRRSSRKEANPFATPSGKKVPIHQKVVDPTGKLIFLADVEVITEDNNLVLKTRTTASGKWVGSLSPGKYNLSIIKIENGKRKRLEFNRTILISASDTPVELETAQLK